MTAVKGRPCLVSSDKISHLGANPVRGGRPPRESRTRGASAVRAGASDQEVARVLSVVELVVLNVRNADEVIKIYVDKARIVREGLNWRTRIIHPRWAIDE